jgi:LPS sulfotransferase NodH
MDKHSAVPTQRHHGIERQRSRVVRRPLVIPEEMQILPKPNFDAIAAQISLAADPCPDPPPTTQFVFLCFTNRSGSNYLGDLLSFTGAFGYPQESLNADTVLPCCKAEDITSFAGYFWNIVRRDAKHHRFIVKVAAEQVALLVASGVLDRISDRTDFLFVNRSDKLGQAISRGIAEQNERWAWDQPARIPDSELQFSAARIAEHIKHIGLHNIAFDRFFALNGIVPVSIEYEWMVRQPQQVIDEIGSRLGIAMDPVDLSLIYFRRQANEINAEWRERFLRESAPAAADQPQ